jgi:hypothetical protein
LLIFLKIGLLTPLFCRQNTVNLIKRVLTDNDIGGIDNVISV